MKISEEIIKAKDSLGITRDEMPQIESKDIKSFLEYLKKEEVLCESCKIPANELKPSQSELDTDKADKMWDESKSESSNPLTMPVFVSKDNRLLDGHHRWLALMRHDESKDMNCYKIALLADEALDVMRDFSKAKFKDINDKKVAEAILESLAEKWRKNEDAGTPRKGGNTTTTDGKEPHYHQFRIDLSGDGYTTFTSEGMKAHFHKIKNFEVQAFEDGHTHEIKVEEQLSISNELPTFKTAYGLEHWLETRAKNILKFNGTVSIGGKTYDSIRQAAKELWKANNETKRLGITN